MSNFLNEFKAYLLHIKKASGNTIDSYISDVEKYASFCDEKCVKICDASESFISSYLNFLYENGTGYSTIIRTRSAINSFYRFLYSINKTTVTKVPSINAVDKEKELPVILTRDEIKMLLESIDQTDLKGIRDRAMLELMYATGLRVGELIDLKFDDFKPSFESLKVNNRTLPIYPDALKKVSLYVNEVRPILASENCDNLFLNMSGSKLTRQGIWKIIKSYSNKARINKSITPHTIRHSFAVHLMENGAEINDICEILGLAEPASAQIYVKLIKSSNNNKLLKFHPMF